MIDRSKSREKLDAAFKLLNEDLSSIDQFKALLALVKGINPNLDKKIDKIQETISKIQKLSKGEVLDLSLEYLPEETEKEKKRKKLIVLLFRYWRELDSEISRIRSELDKGKESGTDKAQIATKVGFFTIAALAVVGVSLLLNKNTPPEKILDKNKQKNETIKVIDFQGKRIPLSEVWAAPAGPECNSPHYHAQDHVAVKDINDSIVYDPGGCGFGRVNETKITEIESKK